MTPEEKVLDRKTALAELTASGQPYEFEIVDLYGHPCRAFKNAPPTLRDLFSQSLSELPFFTYDKETLSFQETWDKASKLSQVFVDEYGIKVGDRVAISMRNYPEWIISFMATTSIGAIAVAMNAQWQSDDMAYGLKDSGAKIFCADSERLERFAKCKDQFPDLPVLSVRAPETYGVKSQPMESLLARAGKGLMPDQNSGPNDDATIFYTSGSTGHPKGVVSCHRNIITALLSWELDGTAGARVMGIEPVKAEKQASVLLAVPLFHATGSHAVYLSSYRAQRRIFSMYKWDVDKATEIIEREQIASVVGPAAVTGDLVAAAKRKSLGLGSLMSVGGGGEPRAPAQVKSIRKTFEKAMPGTGWGMTETNAIGTGIGGQAYLDHPESSGPCSAVLDMRILDESGDELPTGERGELQVRGTSVIRGYWNKPEANAETFVDGWLRTGDIAYLDEEGFLYIVGRIKDLVIRGGENIGCGSVEAALLEHPDVIEAGVYGVPDERLGEEVGATVYSDKQLDADSLREFLGSRLARFAIPRYIRFSDKPLPRTASGKILKRQLREEAAKDL